LTGLIFGVIDVFGSIRKIQRLTANEISADVESQQLPIRKVINARHLHLARDLSFLQENNPGAVTLNREEVGSGGRICSFDETV
jgi:hypothetical protein